MPAEYWPSKHALSSMSKRDISWGQVLEVLNAPEVTYHNTAPSDGNRGVVHQRGHLFVVTMPTPHRHTDDGVPVFRVMTVGLRQEDQWSDADVRNRPKER